jgi:heme-degrading monooxygenase HmoA
MIERIVIMSFTLEHVAEFLQIFDESAEKIRAFPGNKGLRLLENTQLPNQLSTYSYWESEDDLNRYRNSSLFKSTWEKTKPLFESKPIAISNSVIRGPF